MTTAPRTHDDYNIGWICALPLEMAAAKLVLDNVHPTLSQPRQDHNTYVLGDINGHNVVVACLPSGVYGTTAAAVVGSQMLSTYHKIRFGLLVGIGGGVPSASVDIRLGDVVVSNPTGVLPGVVQYDFGRTMETGRIERTGSLSLPHPALLTTLSHVRSDHMMTSPRFQKYVSEILRSREQDDDGEPSMFQYPGQDQDVLFRANYRHLDSEADCWSCDWTQVVGRRQRLSKTSKVHYGLIASGNQVMKDGCTRDSLARQLGIICFEMEAAGLMNHFPCLVIRGICDYADSHKNKSWQGYAALTAAAYAKELLSAISSIHPEPGTRMDPRVQVPESFAVRFSSIDRPHMHFFVGREQELAEINANIQSYACRKSVVLYGLGGIGKTQLALAHIIHYLQFYTAVFWFDATNETAMGKSVMRMIWRVLQDHPSLTQLGAMLEEVDIDAAIEWASRWLSSPSNGRWLLVYDNYMPTSEFSIRPWLPNVPQGHILITARSADPTLGHCIRVSKLGMDHSIRLVCEESGRHDLTGDPDMHELVQELDGLPLSLASAGAFLHQKSISCHDYLKRYKKCWLRTPERTPSPHSDGERKLESTWLVSLGSINEQNATASLLLFLWAALDSQELWFELVQRGRHIFKRSERPVEMDEIAFHEAMRVLCIYGFAEIGPAPRDETNESRGYTLNRCVHAWLVSGVVPDRHQTFNAIALYCVTEHASEFWHIENTYISRFWSFEARNICHRLLPHANHLLHLSLSGLMVTKDQYSHAYFIYRLADIFQKTSFWLSSPMFTMMLNAFQIEHPRTSNMVNQRKSLQQAIALCEGMHEQSFKDLHRDALDRLPPSDIISAISIYIRTVWREPRTCRAASHPHSYMCSRCLRSVCIHVCPWLLILGLTLFHIIVLVWTTLTIRTWEEAIMHITELCICTLTFAFIPRWKHRYKALALGIAIMILQQIYTWFVLHRGIRYDREALLGRMLSMLFFDRALSFYLGTRRLSS